MGFLTPLDIDDQGDSKYPYDEICDVVMSALPDYAFAGYAGPINMANLHRLHKEAARSMYETDTYFAINQWYINHVEAYREEAEKQRAIGRGEFGEILLHALLCDFKGTIPLVSKLYFKDSRGVPAHGFDAVHICPLDKTLWLGESKLYRSGANALEELVEDLKHHFNKDFLTQEYTLISKHLLVNNIPEREYWVKEIASRKRLKDMIKQVNIPLLCIYEDANYKKCLKDALEDIGPVFETKFRRLKKEFDKKNDAPLKEKLNTVLFLFPVLNKEEFVLKLHERLYHLQKS